MTAAAVGSKYGDIRATRLIFLAHMLSLLVRCPGTIAGTAVRSRKRAFATRRQRVFFWSNIRGGGAEPSSDQATLDVSIGRKPASGATLYPVSVCSVRGLRDHMEDDFFVANDFASVFDGHGGESVAKYLRQNLYASLQACLPPASRKTSSFSTEGSLNPNSMDSFGDSLAPPHQAAVPASRNAATSTSTPPALSLKDYETALVRALRKVDREIIRISHWSFQGSTAVICWMLPTNLVVEEDPIISHDHDDGPISSLSRHNTQQESMDTISESSRIHSDDESRSESSSAPSSNATRQPSQPQSHYTHTLLTANIGDSRAILSRNRTSIIELTRDHKPDDPLEKQRIERVGGTIVWHGSIDRHGSPIPGTGVWRVNGNLALARAIGDRAERPAVTSEPELSVIQLTRDDDFVIIATDGLWDVMSSSDCVAFVHALIEEAEEMGSVDYDFIASMLVEEALRRGSYDNITVVVIWLHDHESQSTPSDGGDAAMNDWL